MAGGRVEQRGIGSYTLCSECNNNTGSWYASEFVRLVIASAEILGRAPLAAFDRLTEPRYAEIGVTGREPELRPHPLRLIKQIITMILATNGPGFAERQPELGDFVRERERSGLPERYQVFLALYAGPLGRLNGLSAQVTLRSPTPILSTEVSVPPLSCILTVDAPPDIVETCNITPFSAMPYRAQADIRMTILIGFGHTPFPLDFRTRAMVDAGM